jgi:3D (Asp-Asp-Asp) domain-containing protein
MMIRYFYCVCFLVSGMSLPLLARNPAAPLLPSSSGKGTKGTPTVVPPAPSVAATKAPIIQNSQPALTSDRTRASISATQLSAKPAPAASTPPAPTKSALAVAKVSPVNKAVATSPSKPVVAKTQSIVSRRNVAQRLARVTAYWAGEGDYYTGRCISATGIRLHDGHCAVDPNIIPYGSVVEIEGVGKFLAVDTGSAVIHRTAAREGGHTSAERSAIVVDVFFADRRDGERFAAGAAKYVSISWWTPTSMADEAQAARSLFAEEDWTKIQGKQL